MDNKKKDTDEESIIIKNIDINNDEQKKIHHNPNINEPILTSPCLETPTIHNIDNQSDITNINTNPLDKVTTINSKKNDGFIVSELHNTHYKELMIHVENQIESLIKKAIELYEYKHCIDKCILIESIIFMIINFVSTSLGSSNITLSTREITMHIFFCVSLILSSTSMVIKWFKSKHEKNIENYRTALQDIITKYGQDAYYIIEKKRMQLPPNVLAEGFFRGVGKNDEKNY